MDGVWAFIKQSYRISCNWQPKMERMLFKGLDKHISGRGAHENIETAMQKRWLRHRKARNLSKGSSSANSGQFSKQPLQNGSLEEWTKEGKNIRNFNENGRATRDRDERLMP